MLKGKQVNSTVPTTQSLSGTGRRASYSYTGKSPRLKPGAACDTSNFERWLQASKESALQFSISESNLIAQNPGPKHRFARVESVPTRLLTRGTTLKTLRPVPRSALLPPLPAAGGSLSLPGAVLSCAPQAFLLQSRSFPLNPLPPQIQISRVSSAPTLGPITGPMDPLASSFSTLDIRVQQKDTLYDPMAMGSSADVLSIAHTQDARKALSRLNSTSAARDRDCPSSLSSDSERELDVFLNHNGPGPALKLTGLAHKSDALSPCEEGNSDMLQGPRSNHQHAPAPMRLSSSALSHRSRGTHTTTVSLAMAKIQRAARKKQTLLDSGPPLWPDPQKYNTLSLMLLTLENPMRRAAIRGIEWQWWDRSVLGLILLNTIQLALYNPIVSGNVFL